MGWRAPRKAFARSMTVFFNAIRRRFSNSPFQSQKHASSPDRRGRLKKSRPKNGFIFALACLGGLGAGLGFIREAMDRVFPTTGQVKKGTQHSLRCCGPVGR